MPNSLSRSIILSLILLLGQAPLARAAETTSVANASSNEDLATFDAVTSLVEQHFYDKTLRGLPWPNLKEGVRAELAAKRVDVAQALAHLLAQLKASHTQFLTDADPDYWALTSLFSGKLEEARVRQPGAWFERRGKRWFVRDVLPGSPAASAGLVRGDEIVSVDGAPLAPVASFRDVKPGRSARVAYRRLPWSEPKVVDVSVRLESFAEAWLRATRDSVSVRPVGKHRVGYVRLWSGGVPGAKEALKDAAERFAKEADAVVLDLRGGLGGAEPSYLAPFLSKEAGGTAVFTGPMVVVIDRTTRSGKEWLAHELKRSGRAELVGERSAGAFLKAKLFAVTPGKSALYLPVATAEDLALGIEGHGVTPDREVGGALMYAAGHDPALEEAYLLAGKN